MKKLWPVLAVAAWLLVLPLLASDFYVAPTGSSSGDGTRERPWDLATALGQPPAVKPGDTIWVRGGTYTGHYTSGLSGTSGKPIVVRQYQAERVTIDGNYGGNEVSLYIRGAHTWYWGLEVTNSDLTRTSQTTGAPPTRGEGVWLQGPGTRLINSVVHDAAQGILTTAAAPDAEVYGTLIYYNGFDGPDRGHGHGIYVQNETGTKRIVDNVIFQQFSYGVHGYTEQGRLNNISLEGNTSFDNGSMSSVSGLTTDLLVGASGTPASSPDDSEKVAKNTELRNNLTYFSNSGGVAANLGYSKGIAFPTIVDNYLVGGTALTLVNAFRPITMTGNSLVGSLAGFESSEFPNNTYYSARPSGVKVFVRQNNYEPGRANITIYNWDRAPIVDVNVHGAIMPGTHYELRNAQNFFGAPILSGVYDGSPLRVPMTALTPAAPVGRPAPAPTGPDFQVFVLLPTGPPDASRGRVNLSSAPPRFPGRVQRLESGAALGRAASATLSEVREPRPARVSAGETPGSGLTLEPGCGSARASTRRESLRASPARLAGLPSGGPTRRYFPEAATSALGAACRTSVFITNAGMEPAAVTLTFLEHDRDNASAPTASFVIGPRETFHSDDALRAFFGVKETYGAIELETDEASRLSAFARTVSGSAPTGGGRAEERAIPASEIAPAGTLVDLRADTAAVTEILLVNPNPGGAIVSLTLGGSPERPAETTFVVVPPRGYVRRSLASLFPSTAVASDALLSIAVDAGTLPVLALADVVESAQPQAVTRPATR